MINNISELPVFQRKKNKQDLMADVVDELLSSNSLNDFYFLIGQVQRGEKGKEYKNFENKLPLGGIYQELEVNGSQDARRIVVDMNEFDIFPTRDHYQTISYAGRAYFAQDLKKI